MKHLNDILSLQYCTPSTRINPEVFPLGTPLFPTLWSKAASIKY